MQFGPTGERTWFLINPLDSLTKAQLLDLAKVRGVKLPAGNITKSTVLAALRDAKAPRSGGKP